MWQKLPVPQEKEEKKTSLLLFAKFQDTLTTLQRVTILIPRVSSSRPGKKRDARKRGWRVTSVFCDLSHSALVIVACLDYEQSLFPLRDGRRLLRSLAGLFVSLDYPWAERETDRSLWPVPGFQLVACEQKILREEKKRKRERDSSRSFSPSIFSFARL